MSALFQGMLRRRRWRLAYSASLISTDLPKLLAGRGPPRKVFRTARSETLTFRHELEEGLVQYVRSRPVRRLNWALTRAANWMGDGTGAGRHQGQNVGRKIKRAAANLLRSVGKLRPPDSRGAET